MTHSDRDSTLKAAGAVIHDGVVQRFGAVADERASLDRGAALVDADGRDRVAIVGPDAAQFLDRLLTVGVKTMAPGQGGPAYLLDARGRIQLAFHIYRVDDERFVTDATAGHGAEIVQRLDMFHFGEQLHFESGDGAESSVELHGPKAAATLEALGLPLPEAPGAHDIGQLDGVAVRVVRRDRSAQPGYALRFPPAGYVTVWQRAQAAGAAPVGQDALEAARIAAGRPDHPHELGPHATPLEMGTMDGITEGKGCYPGQEVIERTIALGRPARRLVRLRIDRHVAAGDALNADDGKTVGALTSAAPDGDGMRALALIKQRAAKAGGPWRVGDAVARRDGDDTEGP